MGEAKEVSRTKAVAAPRRKYRHHSEEEKRRIVAETYAPGSSVAVVARRHEVNANQVFNWRRRYRKEGHGLPSPTPANLIPVGVIVPASARPSEEKPEPSRPLPTALPPSSLSPRMPALPVAPKLIEIELRGGTRIRIDGSIKGDALRQILKFARGLA
jgi:transposase